MTEQRQMIESLEQATDVLRDHGTHWLLGVSDITQCQGIKLQADDAWFNEHAPDNAEASWHSRRDLAVWVTWHVSDVLQIGALFYRSEPCRWRGQLIEDVMQELEQLKEPTNETLPH